MRDLALNVKNSYALHLPVLHVLNKVSQEGRVREAGIIGEGREKNSHGSKRRRRNWFYTPEEMHPSEGKACLALEIAIGI